MSNADGVVAARRLASLEVALNNLGELGARRSGID